MPLRLAGLFINRCFCLVAKAISRAFASEVCVASDMHWLIGGRQTRRIVCKLNGLLVFCVSACERRVAKREPCSCMYAW